jgi:1-acyl-sn-glycerol-3-phosphate acyltransferase
MYNTPVLQPIVSALCQFCLAVRGWKLQGHPPTAPKYVMITVPHTSNWDFPLALAMAFVYRFEMHWMGKDSLFSGWRGPIMRWLGGIPINRASRNNVVADTIAAFQASERLIVAIPPEGTRSKVDKWKTGFYYIALGADVPIGLAFLDYQRKVGGFLSTFLPTGNVEKDITDIRACYAGISGKYAEQCVID